MAASGTRSLKIVDAPGLQYEFNPHLVYNPNYRGGTAAVSFDLRLGERVVMYTEGRSWDVQPYRVGPSVHITNGKLEAAGKTMDLPTDEWIHFEITFKVGADADGTWSLAVTLPGQAPRRFDGLNTGSAEFKNLTWFGFSSSAKERTVFYLDNLKIKNVP